MNQSHDAEGAQNYQMMHDATQDINVHTGDGNSTEAENQGTGIKEDG